MFSKNNSALDADQVLSGLAINECTEASSGKRLKESIAFIQVIEKAIESISSTEQFMDCAMGKCKGKIIDLSCKVDTNVEQFLEKNRFSCELIIL